MKSDLEGDRIEVLLRRLTHPVDPSWSPPPEEKDPTKIVFSVVPLDTSGWGQGDFYDKPLSKDLYFQWNDPVPGFRRTTPCVFLSVQARDPNLAIEALRRDLRIVQDNFTVVAFLAKPSVIPLVAAPREGEIPDTVMYAALDPSPRPAVRTYAAFCFIHACKFEQAEIDGGWQVTMRSVTEQMLRDALVTSSVREGEVGKRLD